MRRVKGRREEYSEATRLALIDAATQCFTKRGYSATSLDEIAGLARVTKGALYHHFAGKQALLEAAMDLRERGVHERIAAAAAAEQGDAWAAAFAALDSFLDACCDPVYGRLVFVEGLIGLGWTRWREFEKTYSYGLTESLLRAVIDAGLAHPVPIEAGTRVLVGMLSHAGMLLAEAADDDKQRLREELSQVIRLLATSLQR